MGAQKQFPSLAFRRALAEWECGQGADGTSAFLSSLPTPRSPPAQGPARQLQLKAKPKAASVVQRWFPRLSAPPPPPQQREQRGQGCGHPHPQQLHVTQSRGEKTEALGRGARTVQHPVLPPSQGVKRATLQKAHTGRGLTRGPLLLCAPPRGRLCSAENVCLWGTKSLNLGVGGGGQQGGEVPVLGFPHIRWGKRKPELEGLGRRDSCLGALVGGGGA